MVPKTERFELRLHQDLLDNIDRWRFQQSGMPSRAEAIRRLVEAGLAKEDTLNTGQGFIVCMLCEIYKHFKIKGEMDPDFITKSILEGQLWGLELQYPGIFHHYVASREKLHEVMDILSMFSLIEESITALADADLQDLQSVSGGFLRFCGFDGNTEFEHMGIAGFLINSMGRFLEFKGREINSHCPALDRYKKMLSVFKAIERNLLGRRMTNEELKNIISAPYV